MKTRKLFRALIFIGVISFLAWSVISTTVEDSRIFQYIEDSPLIFLVISFLVLFLLWIIDGLVHLVDRIFNISSKSTIYFLFMTMAILFFGSFAAASWRPFSAIGGILKMTTILVPLFFIFKKLNSSYLLNSSFRDKEVFKFLLILIGGLMLSFVGNWVGYHFDQIYLGIDSDSIFSDEPQLSVFKGVFIGFAFAFAFGNFLNNLRMYLRQQSETEKKLEQSNEEVLETKSQLDSLQASINPHFLYNSLNSIASLATKDGEKTEKMALALSSFYRYVTNKEESHLTTIEDELKMIQNYLEIEKIRFGDQLSVVINCPKELIQRKIPRFILQPLVENAIKYGYSNGEIFVKIDIAQDEHDLLVKIHDGGKPFDEKMKPGYGLQSVSKKLRLLYPEKHQMEFVNEPEKHVFIRLQKN